MMGYKGQKGKRRAARSQTFSLIRLCQQALQKKKKKTEWERFYCSFFSTSDVLFMCSFIEFAVKGIPFHMQHDLLCSAYPEESGFSLHVEHFERVKKTKKKNVNVTGNEKGEEETHAAK